MRAGLLVAMLMLATAAEAKCPCWQTKPDTTKVVSHPAPAGGHKVLHPASHAERPAAKYVAPAVPCRPETLRIVYGPPPDPCHQTIIVENRHRDELMLLGFAVVAGSIIYAANHNHHDTPPATPLYQPPSNHHDCK